MNRKLGRKSDNRDHLLRNLATSLVLYEQIDTTLAKGKEVKSFLDKIIARSKNTDLATIKQLNKIFFDKNAVKKITLELVPRYKDRNSGFIKSYRLKNRLGDNAPMIRLVLVDKMVFADNEKKEEKTENVKAKKAADTDKKPAKAAAKTKKAPKESSNEK